MRTTSFSVLIVAVIAIFCLGEFTDLQAQALKPSQAEIDNYTLGPDSLPQPDVPKGKQFSFAFAESKIFPGTARNITVYVPAQYKADKPACVYVGLDSLGFNVPVVFDNLIHKGEMPVTIAVGVSSGSVPSADGKTNPRFNRSFEFDGLNDALARMIVEEIFPAIEQKQTPDGLPIRLSTNPNDRCTGGGSTGGIGAFTLAWERPDQFRRVFSAIGTFVGMRGGDGYPVLVRKTEPKPIRVFQQDGSNDQWMGGPEVGDWWMGNQTLQRALEFSGYEHEHVWGTGPHSGKHAAAIFPDAMRFLWRGWPEPIVAQTAKTQNVLLQAILDPAESWGIDDGAGQNCGGLAVNPQGEVFIQDTAKQRTLKIGVDGTLSLAPDVPADRIFAFYADGKVATAGDIKSGGITTTPDGRVYAADAEAGKVWLVKPDGAKVLLDQGLRRPTGIALSPDGLWLAVMEHDSPRGYSYRVQPDGTVDAKQRYYWFHVPDWADDSGAGAMCMDRDGRPYVATRMGVQVFDRNGRSRGILPMPAGMPSGEATGICFGGPKFQWLYVASGGNLYTRKMKTPGAPGFQAPIKLPPWGGG